MKREKIKNIILIIVVAVISSTITSFATSNYLFDSIDVKYDNSNGVQAETVQGAIDELYSCASDYASYNNRLTNVEGYFQNNPTSYFNGADLRLGYNNKNSNGTGLILYGNDNARGSRFMYDASNGTTSIDAYNSSGTAGQGLLNLRGNPVQVNGNNAVVSIVAGSTGLNTIYSNQPNSTVYFITGQLEDNLPSGTSGNIHFVISFRTNANWGAQYLFINGEIIYRAMNNGTWSTWKTKVS